MVRTQGTPDASACADTGMTVSGVAVPMRKSTPLCWTSWEATVAGRAEEAAPAQKALALVGHRVIVGPAGGGGLALPGTSLDHPRIRPQARTINEGGPETCPMSHARSTCLPVSVSNTGSTS